MSGPANPTVSTVYNFNPTAGQVVTSAFRKMGVINDMELPTDSQMRDGLTTLNAMLKELEATGIHVWTETEAILFLQQYQTAYQLGAPIGQTSPDHCADNDDWELTALQISALVGDRTVTVQNPTGIAEGDYFGVVTNNNNAFWTTVDDTPAGAVIPLADALPTACNANNFAFAYTTNIVRPLQIPFARRLTYGLTSTSSEPGIITPLTPMLSRQGYFDLPQPRTPGTVNQAYYNPGRDVGTLYVWNAPANAMNGVRFTYYRPILTVQTVDDTTDLPEEWGNALKWNLAMELGPDYSVPAERWDRIVKMATDKAERVMGWDREPQSVTFGRSSDQNPAR